jgi:Gluconate 2-dehydrogenase subunit 3
MNRRDLLQRIGLMMGGVLAAPIMAGAMGEVLYTGTGILPTDNQEALIADVADVIIPDTIDNGNPLPGAKAAEAEKFIVRVMRDCYEKADQEKFYAGLEKLNEDSKTKFGKNFVSLSNEQKIEMIDDASIYNKAFFKQMRELTVTAYFTSKIGATQALAYDPIPGRFDGCSPMTKEQKTWAL